MLTVCIESDSNYSLRDDDGNWTILENGYASVLFEDEVVNDEPMPCTHDLHSKLMHGLAFFIEQRSEGWSFRTSSVPISNIYDIKGLVLWEHDEADIGAVSYEDRQQDAQQFLNLQNKIDRGEVYWYGIEDEGQVFIDSCGGYTDERQMCQDIYYAIKNPDGSVPDFCIEGDAQYSFRKEDIAQYERLVSV